jgi:membrane-associated protein
MPNTSPISTVASNTKLFASSTSALANKTGVLATKTRAFASSTRAMAGQHFHQFSVHYITSPLSIFMGWLATHGSLSYLVLFLGAYFETLIGPSLFIPGELFLLGGSILAGAHILNIWYVMAVLYAGAILGDTSSYWIGRGIGTSIFKDKNKFLNFKNYKKIEKLLEKYGMAGIFLARLVGPFSKFAPVVAGIFEIPFPLFLLYNIPGVLVGCGEFIAAGYFFGNRYQLVLWVMERYTLLFFLFIGLCVIGYWYAKKTKSFHKIRKVFKRK